MIRDLIRKNRSYRRFVQDHTVDLETLKSFVDLARHSASGSNLQPLKYILSCDPNKNDRIFPHLGWAGYLKEWGGPVEGERPSAYVILLGDTDITQSFGVDHGIAAQSILLGSTELGLGGCIIGTVNKKELRQALEIPPRYKILLVLAIGKPKEVVVLETVDLEGDIKYWRDSDGVHHVPKRALEDIILPL